VPFGKISLARDNCFPTIITCALLLITEPDQSLFISVNLGFSLHDTNGLARNRMFSLHLV